MQMSERKTLVHDALVEEIANLCRQRSSGTIFIATPDNQLAKLALVDGEIVCASLRRLHGVEVIKAIAVLESGQFGFNPDLQLVTKREHLPDTETLIGILRSSQSSAPPVDTELAGLLPENQASNADITQILIRESTEYIGPMATVICQEYMQEQPPFPNQHQINQVIHRLEQDINDADKAIKFRQAVLASL